MPNIKSAKKRVIVNGKNALKNQIVKNNLRTTVKAFFKTTETDDKAAVDGAYRAAVKKIDQAVARGVMHKNTAARRKSLLTRKVNSLGAQ